MRYGLSHVRRAVEDPKLVLRELNRLYHTNGSRSEFNDDGFDLFTEDWDNCLILDACRYDLFAAVSTLDGTLARTESRASSTEEFLRANFDGRRLHDTVYVTANPQFHNHRDHLDTEFHDVIDVWREDGWDDETRTVRPETTTAYARRAADRYPNKRLLVHYIQPHYPFMETDTEFDKTQLHDDEQHLSFWDQCALGRVDLDADELWSLYRRNLELTLPHVRDLLDDLSGRSVVTADHGNMFGERRFPVPFREWGHPSGIYTPELVEVPWLVREDGSRRRIEAEQPVQRDRQLENDAVQERLANLGYTD